MPLHLLGKKSWNVYNSASIERVRRDEAQARAREEADEQRMQEEDAARRIAILRGEQPPDILSESARGPSDDDRDAESAGWSKGRPREEQSADTAVLRERKRRRLRGEDDTDRDIRYAREDAEAGDKAARRLVKRDEASQEVDIVDHAGHIQLIPAPDEKAFRKAEKNADLEAEKVKKRTREEDQYTMRFSNAAGNNNHASSKPWYASNKHAKTSDVPSSELVLAEVEERNVWGNEDPRRKERERGRISANDPFAAMQQAQRQLKQSERDRERWNKERLAEVEVVSDKRSHRRHRRREQDEESLDDFSLDAPRERRRDRGDSYDHDRRSHKHRSRHRSRTGDTDAHRKHRSSRERA